MQGLLARLNQQQKTPNMGSKGTSRSASIASSLEGDQNDDEQQSNSDESQSPQTPTTLKPKVKREKKMDIIQANREALKEVKPKKPASKIDTGMSSMVKLKLLDASRKALIDKKKNSTNAYTQTDTFKTKLCKDVSIECQNDLSCPVDKSTETEIELLAIRAKDGTLIITSSCAMNTDTIPTGEVSTQTVMPRSSVAFKRILEDKNKIQYENDDSDDNDSDYTTQELINIERRMKLKTKTTRVKPQKSIDIVIEDEASDIIAIETIPSEKLKTKEKDSDSEFEDSIREDSADDDDQKPKRPTDKSATFNSWNDLDFPKEKVELPRSYFSDGPTPWSNFHDLVLGQRFLNARLVNEQSQRYSRNSNAWSEPQLKIVGDLMREANALMDMFDQVSMLLGPDIKLHKVSDVDEFVLPPNKYEDAMSASCNKLEASLKRLQDIKFPESSAAQH